MGVAWTWKGEYRLAAMEPRLDPTPRSGRCWLSVLALFGLLGVPVGGGAATAPDPLFESFAHPPQRLRPFVRWWWNGSRVAEAEILRQLDVMKAAGIGGFEINTIAMRDDVPKEGLAAFPERPWLSPEWCSAVKAAAEGARARPDRRHHRRLGLALRGALPEAVGADEARPPREEGGERAERLRGLARRARLFR